MNEEINIKKDNENKKSGNIKLILLIIGIVLCAFILFIGTAIYQLIRYHNNNTWANMTVTYVCDGNEDIVINEKDMLKGDVIDAKGTILEIEYVEHQDAVRFKVKSGSLYDKAGNSITEGYMYENNDNEFGLSEGIVKIVVNYIAYY